MHTVYYMYLSPLYELYGIKKRATLKSFKIIYVDHD